MIRFIIWLSKDRLVNLLAVIAVYLSIVVFHDEVTRYAILLRKSVGLTGYNLLILIVTVIASIIILSYLVKKLEKFKSLAGLYLLVTLILVIAAFKGLMTYNIEAIHFFEYMFLAMILFPLVRSYGAVVVWITLLGIADELYQYIILTPFFLYLDFNDMILNLLGAGLGMVAILILLKEEMPIKRRNLKKSPEILAIAFTGIFLLVLYLVGEFRWNPVREGSEVISPWLTAHRKQLPEGFWTEVYKGRIIHIMDHIEGLVVMMVLFVFYYLLDYFAAKGK